MFIFFFQIGAMGAHNQDWRMIQINDQNFTELNILDLRTLSQWHNLYDNTYLILPNNLLFVQEIVQVTHTGTF